MSQRTKEFMKKWQQERQQLQEQDKKTSPANTSETPERKNHLNERED